MLLLFGVTIAVGFIPDVLASDVIIALSSPSSSVAASFCGDLDFGVANFSLAGLGPNERFFGVSSSFFDSKISF